MSKYRNALPQLGDHFYLTDGGLETTLIFNEGLDLPDFAAFHLLTSDSGTASLAKYFRTYAEIATRFSTGLILESATWRANPDWASRLGYSVESLADANRKAITMLEEIRKEHETKDSPMVISGCIGPRGDGYVADNALSADQAEAYHRAQIAAFASSAADMVSAITMNYTDEAIGIARAARAEGMPVAISFTVETDGNLPTGESLKSAIETVDAATAGYPAYYMINCAHPSHFEHLFAERGHWHDRIRGLRANASRRSHAQLSEAPNLDSGNPVELATEYARLTDRLHHLNVMGGCCGTDHRHVEQIAEACSPLFT